jgi:hypothetical protein
MDIMAAHKFMLERRVIEVVSEKTCFQAMCD